MSNGCGNSWRFSALQRAENSSIYDLLKRVAHIERFSALQRAENSSIHTPDDHPDNTREFQCSSASRKFLNNEGIQQWIDEVRVSVLFSEPKIPQSISGYKSLHVNYVSVLFSEPKIPQFINRISHIGGNRRFSALQRAENSSIHRILSMSPSTRQRFSALQRAENSSIAPYDPIRVTTPEFQCSSASRKFLNVSDGGYMELWRASFSALQRAENSSIPTLAPASIHISDRDDHASSFLSLPGASP